MGTVIPFPFERLSCKPAVRRNELATVVILPVVRTERWDDKRPPKPQPPATRSSGPRSRARSSE